MTARHLGLYSWFVYRFTMPAQLQAYATLEYALRERLEGLGLPTSSSVHGRLEFAIANGYLQQEKFRDWPGGTAAADGAPERTWLDSWILQMPERISYMRNDLAHGNFTLYPHHGFTLHVVADAINQLYSADTQR